MQVSPVESLDSKDSYFLSNQGKMGYHLTQKDIDAFLANCKEKGLLSGTVNKYRNVLRRLYQELPDEKVITSDTLAQWRHKLLNDGVSHASTNAMFSTCDTFLEFVGHREYQLRDRFLPGEKVLPELTRKEYLQLLQTARILGKERTYLLVKVFGSTAIRIQEISKLTVESLQDGCVITNFRGLKQTIRIPDVICKGLRSYAKRNEITTGPIFTTRNGTPMNRTVIATDIQRLGEEAHIPAGKANAKALHRLWENVRHGFVSDMELLLDNAMNLTLEQEELSVGWKT